MFCFEIYQGYLITKGSLKPLGEWQGMGTDTPAAHPQGLRAVLLERAHWRRVIAPSCYQRAGQDSRTRDQALEDGNRQEGDEEERDFTDDAF